MKTWLITFLVLAFYNANSITLQDINKITNSNLDEIDSYMNQIGYTYLGTSGEGNSAYDKWINKSINQQPEGWDLVIIYRVGKNPNKPSLIEYQTSSKTKYLSFKEGIKNLGFSYTSTEIILGQSVINYSKGLTSWSFWSHYDNELGATIYSIQRGEKIN